MLRRIGGRLCHEDRHPLQLQVALLRYAVHTLGFPKPSPLQKQSALAAACLSPTRSPTPSKPSWLPPRVDPIDRSSPGTARSVSPRAPGGGTVAATWART